MKKKISYVSSDVSKLIDEFMMGELKYSSEQLMEIAGMSVAKVINKQYRQNNITNILVVCGPGSKKFYL